MWFNENIIYQIYPFGFCNAPTQNDGVLVPRIKKVLDFIPHFKKLNVGAVYFCPVFESTRHGYDTKDFSKIDVRLGSNEDFKEVCDKLHENNIRVILDGVFNHVGRDFFAFLDVKEKKWDSQYKDWFYINFGGNSQYNDGFWYEGWEGHYELVKLNLDNPQVCDYLLNCVNEWIDYFNIDGLRLDVAYMLNRNFMRKLSAFCRSKKPDFFLAGEMIHGNYNDIVCEGMLDSATNYECYKGIYSSLNCMNMFEIAYSLKRQFGKENWCLYTGKHLINFVDNHDVSRLASTLTNENHLKLAYAFLFTIPGIPCIYYGSEWGIQGRKQDGDDALRPSVEKPQFNDLSEFIKKLALAHENSKALCYGDYAELYLTNKQFIFERCFENERIVVMINADECEHTAHYNANCGCGVDLLTGEKFDFGAGSRLEPYCVKLVKIDK